MFCVSLNWFKLYYLRREGREQDVSDTVLGHGGLQRDLGGDVAQDVEAFLVQIAPLGAAEENALINKCSIN